MINSTVVPAGKRAVVGGVSDGLKSGFTMVELAVALTVIGLIAGGILFGRDMIASAQLNKMGKEVQEIVNATQAFRTKYKGMPGDITNATSYWGAAHADFNTCKNTLGAGTQTCNGNGDGAVLYFSTNNGTSGAADIYEPLRFWQHLNNSGLYATKNLTPVFGAAPNLVNPGTQVPMASAGTNSGYFPMYYNQQTCGLNRPGVPSVGHAFKFTDNYRHVIVSGSVRSNNVPMNGAFLPQQAYHIDQKFDDGQPSSGNVMAFRYTLLPGGGAISPADACTKLDPALYTDCTLNPTAGAVPSYNVASTELSCAMIFKMGF